MDDEVEWEYGIMRSGVGAPLHREGMTEEQALEFIAEWLEDGGKPGVFKVVRRSVATWTLAPYESAAIVKDDS